MFHAVRSGGGSGVLCFVSDPCLRRPSSESSHLQASPSRGSGGRLFGAHVHFQFVMLISQQLLGSLFPSLFGRMSTAHRPTWDPAQAREVKGGSRQYSVRDMAAHTKLKFRCEFTPAFLIILCTPSLKKTLFPTPKPSDSPAKPP